MNEAITAAAVTPLARRALLVKLASSMPSTARREKAAEAIIQSEMGDSSLTVSSHIFRAKTNPVRRVLNDAGLVYAHHVAHTLPWQDRGPRLLSVESYDKYSAAMRSLIADVDSAVHALAPIYAGLVSQDIEDRRDTLVKAGKAQRDAASFADDYPSYEQFKEKMQFAFVFSPMPDASHYLFDVSDADKEALTNHIVEAELAAKAELTQRMRVPLLHLVEKLKRAIGTEGAIFRDSALQNIVEQCEVAESLAMGDRAVLDMVQEVRVAIRAFAINPDQLRESPITRAQAATTLEAVASRMSFMSGS